MQHSFKAQNKQNNSFPSGVIYPNSPCQMTPEQPITSERKHKQELKTLAVKTPPGSDWMQMIFNWLIIRDS